jgi:hypothetical protein
MMRCVRHIAKRLNNGPEALAENRHRTEYPTIVQRIYFRPDSSLDQFTGVTP